MATAAAGNNFQFSVVALDRYTKVFRDLNQKAGRSLRPLQQLGRSTAALGRELHFDKVGAGIQKMAAATGALVENLGLASPALRAVGALGLAGGLVAAAGAAAMLANRVGTVGLNVTRTSQRLGMSTSTLQRFRGAAELAGVSADTMQDSLEALGQAMQNARWNRDPRAAALFGAFTHGIATGPGGVNDVGEQMKRVLQAASGMRDPFARQTFLGGFGLSSDMLPLTAGGRAGMDSLMSRAESRGYVLQGEALERATKFNSELWKMKVAFEGVSNTVGSMLLPGITALLTFLDRLAQHPILTMLGITPTSGRGPGAAAPAGAAGAPGAAPGNLPLGLRLNNPGNLRSWGRRPIVNGFASFDSPAAGLSAMANQLAGYQDVRGIDTIEGIVNRWAPAGDGNNVPSYIADLSRRTGFKPGQHLDMHSPGQLATLMRGMVSHEQGQDPFSAQQYQQAAEHVVRVEFSGAVPAGVNVRASVNGAYVPTRIDRAMATSMSVE